MCGIAGIIDKAGVGNLVHRISVLTDRLAHRGPDGSGVFTTNNVAIGHRRLSIIDLAGGAQPMFDEGKQFSLTYNGELYNYKYLRSLLEQKGFRFLTSSDTEVILHAYRHWGEECVRYFRGMFAFGIIDTERQQIFLARDPLGIKPLMYLQTPEMFAFASEIQALKSVASPPVTYDLAAIDEYLFYDFIAAPRTAFKEIRKLAPGHTMTVGFNGEASSQKKYWEIEFKTDYTRSADEWLEELDYTLTNSVVSHLVSDVPFGAFLSGGLDSSTIVAYMAQHLKDPVRTFSIGFDHDQYDESKYSNFVADYWKTEHSLEIVKAEAFSLLPKLVAAYGEPISGPSAIPTYHMCRTAASVNKMVLSGDGADEIFGGYWRYMKWKQLESEAAGRDFAKWVRYHTCFEEKFRNVLWGSSWREVSQSTELPMKRYFERGSRLEHTHQVQFTDINTYLQKILSKMDIMSMLNGLEVRTPFVDIRVFEFAARMPSELNIRGNSEEGFSGKHLMKDLMAKFYPQDFLHREKMGFKVPIQQWLYGNQENRHLLQQRLSSTETALAKLFDLKGLHQIVPQCKDKQLWSLLFLEEWLRQN